MVGIYKITSPSGKIYIGQSINIDSRKNEYERERCKGQPRLYHSIIKYGWGSHTFEMIEECELDDLNKRERYWQDFYNVIGKKGLNCVLTGSEANRYIISTETIEKIKKTLSLFRHSEDAKRRISIGLTGRPCSPETRLKLSKAHKGRDISESQRQKISKALKGRKIPQEVLAKRSASIKGEKNCRAKIVLNTTTGIYYGCIGDAAASIPIPKSTLNGYLINYRPNKTDMIYA